MILVYKNTFYVKKCPVCSLLDYQSTHVFLPLSLHVSLRNKNLSLFAINRCNQMCVCVRLLEWLHWWDTFLCNLSEKHYVIFMTSWHCSLGGNFLADALRYLSWPAISRSWHLAASGMGLGAMSHLAGLLTTLHHIHICFPGQGGNMVTSMGWGFSDFRYLFCFTLLMNKACMYHNHIGLLYIFNSPANEWWVSFSFKNIPASIQIMAWRRLGDKQLSEPMTVILPTDMCVIRSQLVNVETHKADSHNKIRDLAWNWK